MFLYNIQKYSLLFLAFMFLNLLLFHFQPTVRILLLGVPCVLRLFSTAS